MWQHVRTHAGTARAQLRARAELHGLSLHELEALVRERGWQGRVDLHADRDTVIRDLELLLKDA